MIDVDEKLLSNTDCNFADKKFDKNLDKVALITGSAHRVGAAMNNYLHALGYTVIVHYKSSKKDAIDLVDSLNAIRKTSAFAFAGDLGNLQAIENLTYKIKNEFGRLDILVNNASFYAPTILGKATEHDWNKIFDSNLKGPFFLSQSLADLLKTSAGLIINMLDIRAQSPLLNYSLYCMAKAGLSMLTKILAKELAPVVRVNGIAPGIVEWPMQADKANALSNDERDKIISRIPLKKIGRINDIIKALAYILNAEYVTGQTIVVDGGRSINF